MLQGESQVEVQQKIQVEVQKGAGLSQERAGLNQKKAGLSRQTEVRFRCTESG